MRIYVVTRHPKSDEPLCDFCVHRTVSRSPRFAAHVFQQFARFVLFQRESKAPIRRGTRDLNEQRVSFVLDPPDYNM